MSASQANASGPNGLTLNLASNNPFRNRTASPTNSALSPPPLSPFDDPPPRPTSTNPFLDPAENPLARRGTAPDKMSSSPPKKPASPTAEEIFDALTLDDGQAKKPSGRPPPPGGRPPMNRPPGPRGENMPPRPRGPPPKHRPTRSQEEALKARRMQSGSGGEKLISIDSPQKRPSRRPRRNSESSVMDIETEEERKKRKEKERERRYKDAKDKKPNKRIDIIDQLDATSVYGSGLFHHDGPFDACNPHRNRKGSRRAPMHAFAKDSLNMAVGGSGPLNKRPDHATFMGHHDEEAFKDYRQGAKENPGYRPEKNHEQTLWDPKGRDTVLHGDESMGLGTSTFLEGAPAARSAIARRQAEASQQNVENGLARKKSLAQRIRGINRGPNGAGRVNADGSYGPRTGDASAGSNGTPGEHNPFFNEFDKSGEDQITVKRKDSNPATPLSPPVHGAVLERRATTDATAAMATSPDGSSKPQGNGFLSRVKSLKGGRRQRPGIPANEEAAPGTAV